MPYNSEPEDKINSIFCIRAEQSLKCKNPTFEEFEDETNVIITLLQYFKTYLPIIMNHKLDCRGRNIKIDPNDIGVTVQKDYGDYIIVLIPSDDNSQYIDDRYSLEETDYSFQLAMEVREVDSEGCLENLIKLKSGIKTMLTSLYANLNLNIVIDGFSYIGPNDLENSNKIIRSGVYRFSILDSKYKK